MSRRLVLVEMLIVLLMSAGLSTAQDGSGTATVQVVNATGGSIVVNVALDGKSGAAATLEFGGSASLVLEPGTHAIALSASGTGPVSGDIGKPISLNLKAGDQHLITVFWATPEAKALTASDVDVSAAAGDNDDWAYVIVNALPGAPAAQLMVDGKPFTDPIAYGKSGVASIPPANYDSFQIVAANNPSAVLFDLGAAFVEPGLNYVSVLFGKFPGKMWQDYSLSNPETMARTNAWDYLSAFNKYTVGTTVFTPDYPYQHDDWKFTIFLKAVEAAGLKDLLTGDTALTVFPPTDAAFGRLPAGALDKLMANPAALKTLVENHILQAPTVDLGSMNGKALEMMGGLRPVASESDAGVVVLDGIVTGYGNSYHVTNGTVYPLDRVLQLGEDDTGAVSV